MAEIKTDNICENSVSSEKKIVKKKDLCLSRIACGLMITGLFILIVAVLVTILLWCRVPDSQPSHKIEFEDKGDIDIDITVESARSRIMRLHENIDFKPDGNICHVDSCKMSCSKTTDLYNKIYQAVLHSGCHTIEHIILFNETFDEQTYLSKEKLEKSFKKLYASVGEILLISPKISSNSMPFLDSSIFQSTFSLSIIDGQLSYAGDELLRGLPSLRYLTLLININYLSPDFFYPTTNQLINLIFTANLRLSGNVSFFGQAEMNNLISLDLSMNFIVGPLSKNFLGSLPNLKYLRLQQCHITSIEIGALDQFTNHLILLDLSHNQLTTISNDVLKPLLLTSKKLLIDLRYNEWSCDCQLVPFFISYLTFVDKFFEGNFCSKPDKVQGLLWHALYNLEEECLSDRVQALRSELTPSVEPPPFDVSSPESGSDEINVHTTPKTMSDDLFTNQFPRSQYKFELMLQKNNSVLVRIIDCPTNIDVNVLWLPEWNDNNLKKSDLGYRCDYYVFPYFTTNILEEDTTYTFCIVGVDKTTVSPYDCLPFYVPSQQLPYEMDVWIPLEYKQLTILTLCLSLVFSLILGSGLAYWSLKAYPNLLQGSQNDLPMKQEPDRFIHVSTISDAEGMNKSLNSDAPYTRKFSTDSQNGFGRAKPMDLPQSFELNVIKRRLDICSGCMQDNYEIPNSCKCAEEKLDSKNMPPPLPQRNSK